MPKTLIPKNSYPPAASWAGATRPESQKKRLGLSSPKARKSTSSPLAERLRKRPWTPCWGQPAISERLVSWREKRWSSDLAKTSTPKSSANGPHKQFAPRRRSSPRRGALFLTPWNFGLYPNNSGRGRSQGSAASDRSTWADASPQRPSDLPAHPDW